MAKQRIAVFGSWRDSGKQQIILEQRNLEKIWSNDNTEEAFQKACRDIGRELAISGDQIIVASDSSSTVDFHIVQGIIEVSEKVSSTSRPPIQIVRSSARRSSREDGDCSNIYQDAIEQYPALFGEPIFFDEGQNNIAVSWEQVHDFVATIADKILVLGGGASSHRIAVRALADGKPVTPIGVFGGAGRELVEMLENVRDEAKFPKYKYRKILNGNEWGEEQINTVLYSLHIKKDPDARRKIFINYRRSDSSMAAGRIHERLCDVFDNEDVFLDTHSIKITKKFEEVIKKELDKTLILLVLIGPTWLSIQNEKNGKRRLDEEEDFVRREIEIALHDGIKIIPILLEGAQMPNKTAMPKSIEEVAEWQAYSISTHQFRDDLKKLIVDIKKFLPVN